MLTKLLVIGGLALIAGGAGTAPEKNIVDTAAAAGSFNTLVQAVQAADLTATLEGPGPFTVFAPTDQAFAKLPAGTLQTLLQPENKEKLRAILTYHVVAGDLDAAKVAKLHSVKTVEGADLQIVNKNGSVMVDNAKVVKADIRTSNGIIHVIDEVMLPPNK
jgi:transforming growth factor-beta-induced protein